MNNFFRCFRLSACFESAGAAHADGAQSYAALLAGIPQFDSVQPVAQQDVQSQCRYDHSAFAVSSQVKIPNT